MNIQIDRESRVPVYQQISGKIKEMVLSGRMPPGYRLPPERRLAAALKVNRSTILNAYRELKAGGLVDAHVGRGTAVVARRFAGAEPQRAQVLPWRQFARAGVSREDDPLLRDLLELTERRDLVSLSVGLPAPELLPLDTVRDILGRILADVGPPSLLHCPTEGLTVLREAVSRQMASRGVQCGAPDVLITSGSQQGLDLMARILIDPGDMVVVEEPSFFVALQVFRSAGARLIGVPVDQDGIRTDVLESIFSRFHPKLVYTLPTFQNPSGAVMSLDRRRHLLAIAYRYQIPILEDDPYHDLRYDGEPLPPLKALDMYGHVAYLSSFSKVLFPGLRLGWLVAQRPVIRQLALAKQSLDLHSNTLGQHLVQRFLDDGHYDDHLRRVRPVYARRRDAMDTVLRANARDHMTWRRPDGGFYFWCQLPPSVSLARLLAEAAEEKVSFLPGGACFAGEPAEPHIRLNFSFPSEEQIGDGVLALMRAMRRAIDEPARGRHRGTPPIV
ncbi:MAG: PLP-dependent aminotransferase family protein [Acidobacteriota bacterium]